METIAFAKDTLPMMGKFLNGIILQRLDLRMRIFADIATEKKRKFHAAL